MAETKTDKSLGELFSELTRDMGNLVRQEVQLAKAEMTQKVAGVVKGVGSLAVGGVLIFMGAQALVATAIIALALVLPLWAAALIVTAVFILLGGILLMMGLKALKKTDVAPKQTIETLKEDAQWAKQQVT